MLSLVLQGLAFGGVLALIALGIGLTNRVSGHTNLAQADLAVLAGYLGVTLAVSLQPPLPLWITYLVLGGLFAGVLSLLFWGLLARRREYAATVALALGGLALALRSGMEAIWLPQPLPVPSLVETTPLVVAGVALPSAQLFSLGLVAAVLGLGWLVLHTSREGLILRAVLGNPVAAGLIGLPVWRSRLLLVAGGGALAALAGLLVTPVTFAQPGVGAVLVAALALGMLVAGWDHLLATIIGCLCAGLAWVLSAAVLPGLWRDVALLALALLVAWRLPNGVFMRSPS